MSTGSKLKYARNFRKKTMKGLGLEMGFPENQADSRIAQYESNNKMPRQDVIEELAKKLDINPTYLKEPDPENSVGVLQFLFELDRIYHIETNVNDDAITLTIPFNQKNRFIGIELTEWLYIKKLYELGQISKEDYEEWKLQYPNTHNANHLLTDEAHKILQNYNEIQSAILTGDSKFTKDEFIEAFSKMAKLLDEFD